MVSDRVPSTTVTLSGSDCFGLDKLGDNIPHHTLNEGLEELAKHLGVKPDPT